MNLKHLREYFYIPKNERIISFIILLIINVIICVSYLFHNDKTPKEITVIEVGASRKQSVILPNSHSEKNENTGIIYVNKIGAKEWEGLGFSAKQVKMILSFKKKINGFNDKKDLQKVYCIEEDFILKNNRRLNFSKSPNSENQDLIKEEVQKSKPIQVPNTKVDLNNCNQNDLKKVYGIGEVLSGRIIKYRDLLGGFVHKSQLKEVYGISEENYQNFKDEFVVQKELKQIELNSADFRELIRHPYLNKSQVKSIIKYREQHGPFTSKNELKQIYSISDSIFVKIQPYIFIKK